MKMVILRSLKKNSWAGVAKYRNCWDYLAPYLTRSGRVYTGFNVVGTDEEAEELEKERLQLEKKLGLDLSPNSDYWANFIIRIGSSDLFLDVDDPQDRLRYFFLKGHKRVKNSLLENKASADYVLINKDEEAQRENQFNKIKRLANKEFDKLTPGDQRKALRLFGVNADDMSNEVVEQRLYAIVDNNPERFIDKWVNNEVRELEVLLERAVSANVVRRHQFTYKYGTEVIGKDKEEAVHFLNNIKNHDIKAAIMNDLDAKSYLSTKDVTNPRPKINDLLGITDEERSKHTESIDNAAAKANTEKLKKELKK